MWPGTAQTLHRIMDGTPCCTERSHPFGKVFIMTWQSDRVDISGKRFFGVPSWMNLWVSESQYLLMRSSSCYPSCFLRVLTFDQTSIMTRRRSACWLCSFCTMQLPRVHDCWHAHGWNIPLIEVPHTSPPTTFSSAFHKLSPGWFGATGNWNRSEQLLTLNVHPMADLWVIS